MAEGLDPSTTPLADICSKELTTVSPDDDIDRVIRVMAEKAVRRVLVTDAQNKAIGVLSIGDLAIERDARSLLGQISAAFPNN